MPTPSSKGLSVKAYFDIEAQVLYQRYLTFETLLPASERSGSSHPGDEGRHVEALLRDFLNRHLPLDIRAYSGFIYRPATKIGDFDLSRVEGDDGRSSQLDVLIYDEACYPIYERYQEVVVVPPEGVIGIVSVKKSLYASQLKKEMGHLRDAMALCRQDTMREPYSALFAVTNGDLPTELDSLGKKIFTAVKHIYRDVRFSTAVNEVTVFDTAVVFKWHPNSSPSGRARYVLVDCRPDGTENVTGIALQRMLQSIMSVYYSRRRIVRPGFVSFEKGTFRGPVLGEISVRSD